MQESLDELYKAIQGKNVLLFVGAGVSINLGLPSFSDLVNHIAEELGYDKEVFSLLGDYLNLSEYYYLNQDSLAPLCSWMDRIWHNPDIDISKSKIHQYIVNLGQPLIYTTNYDRWIEHAYDYHGVEYNKIANVGDLANARSDVTQIVKFHGDFDCDDKSIVLTESSYFERLSFESPLDIKLRADVLGKTILFIGYSLSDINIRYLLYKLQKQWERSKYNSLRPKSYIFLGRPNIVQGKVLRSRGIEPIFSKNDDLKIGLTDFLAKLIEKTVYTAPQE